ncbi:MAG: alpha/beta hydrolase [Nitrospirota bacterium]
MRIFYRFILFCLLLATTGCSSLFFHPSRNMQEGPAVKLFNHRDIVFASSDGVPIHGWYFPAENALGSILVLHGNAQNLSTHVNSVLWLVKEGYNLFIIDYRGYGWSGGEPTLEGVHRDADAALEKLMSMPETDPDRVVVLGQSLGGSIATYTVARSRHKDRIRALVIDSAFSSFRCIAREKLGSFWLTWPFQYPLSWTVNDDYSAEKWIGQVSPMPVLILHGLDDPVVPLHHGRMLGEAARQPKEIWLTARPGHVQSFGDESLRKNFVDYLSRVLRSKPTVGPPAKGS